MITLLLAFGCSGASSSSVVDTTATTLDQTECAVCGMTVSEQPTPRAQLVRRDGTRAHFCALGELRADLQAPSPHGEAVAIYVEALPADFDPASTSTGALPWVKAEQAGYVFGTERPLVMGLPVLSFEDEATAAAAAARLGLEAASWPATRDTPFNEVP